MERMSSVAMREMGVVSPGLCAWNEPLVFQVVTGTSVPESSFGGDRPVGRSVRRSAAGM